MPDVGLGAIAVANGDDKHDYELALLFRIIEDFLNLERKESSRLVKKLIGQPTVTGTNSRVATSKAKTPIVALSVPLDYYAGTYYDPGYGNITFCSPTPHPSTLCTPVLEAWSYFENTTNRGADVLYASIATVWISHLRLTHQSNNTFRLDGTYLFPHGYGRDTSPFQTSDTPETYATVEFWVEGTGAEAKVFGAAINGFAKEMTERQRVGGNLADTAEIWLERVS